MSKRSVVDCIYHRIVHRSQLACQCTGLTADCAIAQNGKHNTVAWASPSNSVSPLSEWI